MNFLGNAFTAGKNKVVDAVQRGEIIHFLQSNGTPFMHRTLSPSRQRFEMVDECVSYAGECWFFGQGLLELFGEHFEVRDE